MANTLPGIAPPDITLTDPPNGAGLISKAAQTAQTTVAPAQTYTAERMTPTQAVMDQQKGTVEERVKGLISQNSGLMQLADTQAKQEMNDRGTLQSSMASGARQDAVMRQAQLIASEDAAATNKFALTNADIANKASMVNMEAGNKASEFGAQQQNAMATTQANLNADVGKANTAQQNAFVMNNLDNANRVTLAEMAQKNQTLVSSNATASKAYTDTMNLIAGIQQSTTMDAVTKQTNVDNAVQMLKVSLAMTNALNGLNVNWDELLDFGKVSGSGATAGNQAINDKAYQDALTALTKQNADQQYQNWIKHQQDYRQSLG